MSDVKKVELGYSVPKERWKNAAENLREFGDLYAAKLIKENVDGLGQQDAEDWLADILLAWTALNFVAEFAADKCRMVPVFKGKEDGGHDR